MCGEERFNGGLGIWCSGERSDICSTCGAILEAGDAFPAVVMAAVGFDAIKKKRPATKKKKKISGELFFFEK